jgi:hypothetical protein
MFANTTDYIILLDFVDVFLLIVNILIRRMNNHFINLENDFFEVQITYGSKMFFFSDCM